METQTHYMKKPTQRALVRHLDGDFYTKYLARHYDKLTKMTGWRKKIAQHALDGVAPCKMLDVGCGTGYLLSIAQSRGFDVTGVDPSKGMLEQAHRDYGISHDKLVHSTAEKLPFADASFDFVVASGSLSYVPQVEFAIKEIVRVAKKGVLIRVIDHTTARKKKITAGFWFAYTQASGFIFHDYEYYFKQCGVPEVGHRNLGRGGFMQMFDYRK